MGDPNFPAPVPAMPVPAQPVQPDAPLPSRASNGVTLARSAGAPKRVRRVKAPAPEIMRHRRNMAQKRKAAVKAKPAVKARRVKRKVGKHPALAAPYKQQADVYGAMARAATVHAAKNPNRPLEMKNQLQAVLAMTGVLKSSELKVFSATLAGMQPLSRSSKRRVIAALAQVYP